MIVVAVIDGEFTVKTLRKRAGRVWLQPENPAFPDIALSEERDCSVWGVVVVCARKFQRT